MQQVKHAIRQRTLAGAVENPGSQGVGAHHPIKRGAICCAHSALASANAAESRMDASCWNHTALRPIATLFLPANLCRRVVFAFSKPSVATLVLAELAAFGYVAGASVPLRVAVRTMVALGTLRTVQSLVAVS